LEAGRELSFIFGRYEYRCCKREALQIDIFSPNSHFRTSWRTLPATQANLERFAVYCAMYNARLYRDVIFTRFFQQLRCES
jgi:hypothetical protein